MVESNVGVGAGQVLIRAPSSGAKTLRGPAGGGTEH